MMDTSAMVAALVAEHEHHRLVRPYLRAATPVAGIVLAETFSQLRRTFSQSARDAISLLSPWTADAERILPTSAAVVAGTFARAVELDLAGSFHDALIAGICLERDLELLTLDGRQHRIALAIGARSTYVLA